jgi:3',5'-cyclic AMP phosphodiesterase CpdA
MKKIYLLTLFILCMSSSFGQNLIRGPYLMVGTSSSIVIRWRTDQPSTSQVRFGSAADALTQVVTDQNLVTEHIVKLTGLSPKTRYFYNVGSTAKVLQGDAENYFETTPVPGKPGKYRFGIYGDCGTNSIIQGLTRDHMNAYLNGSYMDAWLLLGDNAYAFGMDSEYQSNFFNFYKDSFMKKSPLYPTPGNHDYNNDNPDRQNDHDIAYYKVFSMPTKGEAGGVASETQSYYSYDYGNVHFLSLDSYGREDRATRLYDTLGRQVQWIKADLAANKNKEWIVAYWHHPPFSQGSRNSETDPEMTAIRQNFIRILERNGVDLIICGHSHVYERSRMMGGFYDYQTAFNPSVHNYSSSSGKYDGSENSCPYIKNPGNNKGTVYVVSGSAGHLGVPSPGYPHKAMCYSNNEKGGAMLLEVEGNRLEAKWLGEDGVIRDKFTMFKDVNKIHPISVEYGSSITLTPSYVGKYLWNTGENTKNITVAPTVSAEYRVTDEFNCVSDVFKVNVSNPLPVRLTSFSGSADATNVVTLKWTTSFEANSAFFAIERSLNGTDFQEAGRIAASKNATQTTNYDWRDETSSNVSNRDSLLYRLRMIDQDGRATLSRVVAVKIERIEKAVDIEVAPNPAKSGEVQIRLLGKETANAIITLTDHSGRTLLNKELKLTTTPLSCLPENLPTGLYILKAAVEGTNLVKKVVIH